MKELLRTNNPVEMSWLKALLAEHGIEAIVLDEHTGGLMHGMMDIYPRLMVLDEDWESAEKLFVEHKKKFERNV